MTDEKFVEELADRIESSGDVSYVSDVHERIDGRWAFTIAGKNRRISVIIDDSKDEAIISPIYYDDEFPVTDEVSTPIDFSDIDYSCNSILDAMREFGFPTSSDLKASYRKAAGRHSDPYRSELKNFVDELIDEIKHVSDYGIYGLDHYTDDGDVWTFSVTTDDFYTYVAIDGDVVRLEPDFDPGLAVEYPMDLSGNEFNVVGEANSIIEQVDDYQYSFDEMQ